jgi:hypothetical protein
MVASFMLQQGRARYSTIVDGEIRPGLGVIGLGVIGLGVVGGGFVD